MPPKKIRKIHAKSSVKGGAAVEKAPASPSPTVATIVVPTKIVEGQPLPTLKSPQPRNLSDGEYKSIKESAVLATALESSRLKWMNGAFFERFCGNAKATKTSKKHTPEEKLARDKDTSLRKELREIGHIQMTVEPHIFDVKLYIKKAQAKVQGTGPQYYTQQSQPGAYGRPQQVQDQHNTPHSSSYGVHPTPPPKAKPRAVSTHPQPAPAAPAPQAAPDPVIQMLAQRASQDAELRAIMKIVAAGNGTTTQLEYFQRHINELTHILEESKKNQAKNAPSPSAPQQTAPVPAVKATPTPTPTAAPPTPSPAPAQAPAAAQPTPPPPKPYVQSPHQPIQQPPPRSQTAPGYAPTQPQELYMEFNDKDSLDIVRFPSHSILEFFPQGRGCLASFLLIDRKSKPDGPGDPTIDVYQPVTAYFAGPDSSLTALAKAVHPPDVTCKYMDNLFDEMKPAEERHLTLRLRREAAGEEIVEIANGQNGS